MGNDSLRYATTSDGVRIAYSITGSGPPLVHMPKANCANWPPRQA